MKIALVQMKMSDDIENNLSTSLNSIERAANSGAELVNFFAYPANYERRWWHGDQEAQEYLA